MTTTEIILTIVSPFISAFLIYYFGVKGKRKETDIQKEKELNSILSNLLMVWHYLTRIEIVIEIIKDNNQNSLIPKKILPIIIFKTGFLSDKCFSDLDSSTEVLKIYDPILFFKLEGIGNSYDTIRKKFILPLISNPKADTSLLGNTAEAFLGEILNDLEKYMKIVAKKISIKTFLKVRKYINDHLTEDSNDLITEFNKKYYEIIINIMPDNIGPKPTFEQFVELINTEESKKLIESQLEIFTNTTFEDFIEIVMTNPDISLDEVQTLINKKINSST